MVINDNEFTAPWNDQFYDVVFYFTLNWDNVKFTSEQLMIQMVLSGPCEYSYYELKTLACDRIREEYDFDYDEIIIVNINEH